jgi:type IV pilus assembly protein PilC
VISLDKIQNIEEKETNNWLDKLVLLMNKDMKLGSTVMNDQVRQAFYVELQVLLNAGIDIRTALELIEEEQKKQNTKKVIDELKQQVISGKSLSMAMQHSKEFTAYEYFSVQIGEESGKLNTVLKELAIYYKSKIKLRRQLISALTYPAVVLTTSIGAIFFMLNFIVPMFSDIFKRFGNNLPWITQRIVNFSNTLRGNIWWILLFLVVAIVFTYTRRKHNWFREYSSKIVLRLPIVGILIQKIYLARFANALALLISARIPILRAIQLVNQMINFYPIEVSLKKIEEDVLQGNPLNKAMQCFSVYPAKMISLIKVGEEVNKLDEFFSQISEQYTQEVEHQSSVISSLLEPIILLVLGAIVGVILISMYLPLFQMSSVF